MSETKLDMIRQNVPQPGLSDERIQGIAMRALGYSNADMNGDEKWENSILIERCCDAIRTAIATAETLPTVSSDDEWWWINPEKNLISGPWAPTSDAPWLVLHESKAKAWDNGIGAIKLIRRNGESDGK